MSRICALSAVGPKRTFGDRGSMSAIPPILLQNSDVFATGVVYILPYIVPLSPMGELRHRRNQCLTHQLCWTGRRRWRRTVEKLDEPPQILRGCGEQDLISRAGQASQSKPVEPEDALHMRKSHLDLLALAE